MYLQRFYAEGQGQASYLVGNNGKAAVIDPKRDVMDYLVDAEAEELQIEAILLTHIPTDFVSGYKELAQKTGAHIYASKSANLKCSYNRVEESDVIPIGRLAITVMDTPGHSPDGISYLVRENDKSKAVFTGDTLLAGDIARPDLQGPNCDIEDMAGQLFDSLHKLFKLPDTAFVYPGHGQGSLCANKISSEPFSTIGRERYLNWALAIEDKDSFVQAIQASMPERPSYFDNLYQLNQKGADSFQSFTRIKHLNHENLEGLSTYDLTMIDTRPADFFGQGHFPGSLNIGLSSPLFSTWVGFFVPFEEPIVLIVGDYNSLEKANIEMARIGYDNIKGYLLAEDLEKATQLTKLSVCDLNDAIEEDDDFTIVDVRTAEEWKENHIETAIHIPLPLLPLKLKKLSREEPLALICCSGYRSSIAASFLKSKGFEHPQNVMGGMQAYQETPCKPLKPHNIVFAAKKFLSL